MGVCLDSGIPGRLHFRLPLVLGREGPGAWRQIAPGSGQKDTHGMPFSCPHCTGGHLGVWRPQEEAEKSCWSTSLLRPSKATP